MSAEDHRVDRLEAELKQVKRERDAAISDLYLVCEDTPDACQLCKHLPCFPENNHCLGWEWRGPQKEAN